MWILVEQFLLQILVVVAIIQIKILNTDVEKGFMWTVFVHEWIDPKVQTNVDNGEDLFIGFLPCTEREVN